MLTGRAHRHDFGTVLSKKHGKLGCPWWRGPTIPDRHLSGALMLKILLFMESEKDEMTGFSELKRTFTVPMEINYVRSKQVNFPCMCVFSRDLTHILKLDAIHSTNIWIFRRSYAGYELQ